jgi:hypothetical protein
MSIYEDIVTNSHIQYIQYIIDPYIPVQELQDLIVEYIGVLTPKTNKRRTRITKNTYCVYTLSICKRIQEKYPEFPLHTTYFYISNIEGISSSFDENIKEFTNITVYPVVLFVHNGVIQPRLEKKFDIDLTQKIHKETFGETTLGNYIDIIGSYSLVKKVLI